MVPNIKNPQSVRAGDFFCLGVPPVLKKDGVGASVPSDEKSEPLQSLTSSALRLTCFDASRMSHTNGNEYAMQGLP